MKKLTCLALVAVISISAWPTAAQTSSVDVNFLAECAAVFSSKASDAQQHRKNPAAIETYLAAAADFYKVAKNKGGEGIKAVYDQKLAEFSNVASNDAVGIQAKKALEKQCRLAAPDFGIKINRKY